MSIREDIQEPYSKGQVAELVRAGRIDLANGYTFVWYLDGTEVYGMTEAPSGAIVAGSGGWYRTDDANAAAKIAAGNLARGE